MHQFTSSEFAERGRLLILAGGDPRDVEAAQPVFDAVGRETIYCGASGSGTRTKLINNYMSTALNVLTAEVLTFAEVAGLDVMRTVKILAGTAAGEGFLTGAYDRKIFSGDISPEFGLARDTQTQSGTARQDIQRLEGRPANVRSRIWTFDVYAQVIL